MDFQRLRHPKPVQPEGCCTCACCPSKNCSPCSPYCPCISFYWHHFSALSRSCQYCIRILHVIPSESRLPYQRRMTRVFPIAPGDAREASHIPAAGAAGDRKPQKKLHCSLSLNDVPTEDTRHDSDTTRTRLGQESRRLNTDTTRGSFIAEGPSRPREERPAPAPAGLKAIRYVSCSVVPARIRVGQRPGRGPPRHQTVQTKRHSAKRHCISSTISSSSWRDSAPLGEILSS